VFEINASAAGDKLYFLSRMMPMRRVKPGPSNRPNPEARIDLQLHAPERQKCDPQACLHHAHRRGHIGHFAGRHGEPAAAANALSTLGAPRCLDERYESCFAKLSTSSVAASRSDGLPEKKAHIAPACGDGFDIASHMNIGNPKLDLSDFTIATILSPKYRLSGIERRDAFFAELAMAVAERPPQWTAMHRCGLRPCACRAGPATIAIMLSNCCSMEDRTAQAPVRQCQAELPRGAVETD